MRVLVITPWFPSRPTDQAGNFILHSVEALHDAGMTLSVIVAKPWTPRAFARMRPEWDRPPLQREMFDPALNIDVAHFPSVPGSYWNELAGPLFRVGTRGSIVRAITKTTPDLIHAHTEVAGYAVLPIARKFDIPVVATLHGINTEKRLLDTPWKRRRMRDALVAMRRVVIVGEPLRAYFGAIAGRDDHFRVVPNGFVIPERVTVRPAVPGPTLRWISVSNLHEGKGVDLTLQALARIRQGGTADWSYDIVGDGAERPSLEALTDALGLRDRVTFHGRMPHDEAMRVLSQADAFVLPSYREAFGIAYLEAMALGLLTIGVGGQGPAAFIAHGSTGLLLRPNDVDSLVQTMQFVLENRAEARRIAAAGQRLVRGEFTWAAHAHKLIAVYREALGER
jgi:glycosyltransferase involved in cell wall biosynthesis